MPILNLDEILLPDPAVFGNPHLNGQQSAVVYSGSSARVYSEQVGANTLHLVTLADGRTFTVASALFYKCSGSFFEPPSNLAGQRLLIVLLSVVGSQEPSPQGVLSFTLSDRVEEVAVASSVPYAGTLTIPPVGIALVAKSATSLAARDVRAFEIPVEPTPLIDDAGFGLLDTDGSPIVDEVDRVVYRDDCFCDTASALPPCAVELIVNGTVI